MTIQERFTGAAGRALTGAGILAIEHGQALLDTDLLLLGLAEAPDPTPALRRVDAAAVRQEIDRGPRGTHDRELLATLGIDVDEVTRRLYRGIGIRPDDPRLWTLRRSPVRPLRMTLSGPTGTVVLTGQSRKVVEVAAWAAGRGRPIAGDHLLQGLLADGMNRSVRILCRIGIDPRELGRDFNGRA